MAIAATLDNTIGAMLTGVVLSAILYGVSCMQTWNYFTASRETRDPLWLMATVAGVWASDTTHLGMCFAVVYHYTISEFANPTALNVVYWPVVAQVMFNGITAVLVQGFFARRIYLLSNKSLVLYVPIVVVMVAQFIINTVYVVQTLPVKAFEDTNRGLTGGLDASTILADLLISTVLCTLLSRSRTEFSRTNSLINKLMIFTVNTGLITSLTAVAKLTCYYAMPNSLVYIAIYWCLGRLYCNSFLAALNTRDSLRKTGSQDVNYSLEDRGSRNGGTGQSLHRSVNALSPRWPGPQVAVQIETTHDGAHATESKDSFVSPLTPGIYSRKDMA